MNNIEILDTVMNEIIDELNPNYKPTSDEELIDMQDDRGVYQRSFRHRNGPEFLVKWAVYYGTPETVRTVFESVEEL
jgi:DNA/RNA-binding domain of Phe-tRNA-synthetase-like protein